MSQLDHFYNHDHHTIASVLEQNDNFWCLLSLQMVKNIPKFWVWKENSPYKVGPSILVGSERSKKISITNLLAENLSAKTDEKVAWWQNFYNQWIFLTTEISNQGIFFTNK